MQKIIKKSVDGWVTQQVIFILMRIFRHIITIETVMELLSVLALRKVTIISIVCNALFQLFNHVWPVSRHIPNVNYKHMCNLIYSFYKVTLLMWDFNKYIYL